MAAGASPSLGDEVLIVVDSGSERRYFYSATTGVRGLGYLGSNGEVKVYRLDQEATNNLDQAIKPAIKSGKHNPSTGKWLPATAERLKDIIQNCTGIRRS